MMQRIVETRTYADEMSVGTRVETVPERLRREADASTDPKWAAHLRRLADQVERESPFDASGPSTFFRGLALAVLLSVLLWAGIIMLVALVLE